MGKGITLKGVDVAGGVQLAGGQSIFKVNGIPVVMLGDPVGEHGKSPHNTPVMVEGSSLFRINGTPVVLAGHLASCGHPTSGQSLFKVTA